MNALCPYLIFSSTYKGQQLLIINILAIYFDSCLHIPVFYVFNNLL